MNLRRLLRATSADLWVGGGLLVAMALAALAGPLVWPVDPLKSTLAAAMKPPGAIVAGQWYPLGTDQLGRDQLARILAGLRLSLAIVVVAGLISFTLGTLLGLVAGYFRGIVDTLVMRAVDIQLSIPFILLILLVVAVVGPSIGNQIAVLGVTGWAIFARVARARTLEVRELDYVAAAQTLGLPTRRILFRHLLPNILTPQIVLLTLDLPRLVVLEASIGFLGLGVQPPTPTLGNMIGEGRSLMLVADWLVLWPGVAIAILVVGFNFLGDGLIRRTEVRVA